MPSKPKPVKIYYFKSEEINLKSYMLNLKIQSIENSIEYRGNYIQLRDIKEQNGFVLGRLCKIRLIDKPTVGSVKSANEEIEEKDVIESAYFIYDEKNKIIAIQKNTDVSNNPNSLMSKLLVGTHPKDLSSGLNISAIVRKDAVEEIIKQKGSAKRLRVKTTKGGRAVLSKESDADIDFDNDYLDDTLYSDITIDYKLEIGTLKEGTVSKLKKFFKAGKIKDAAFVIDGEASPIKLSKYVKFETIHVDVENGNFDKESFKNELLEMVRRDEE